MRVSRPKTSLILWIFLLTFFSIPIIARADDDDEPDDYDVKARVVRISLMGGEVNLKRNGNQDWEPARLNYPLVEGDTIATGNDSRLEIQVDARNFVRLTASSTLRIITLRDEGIAVSVVEGTVTVRLAKFDRKQGYFEVDAPQTTLAAEKEGSYRIDVPRDGRVRLTVRDGGSARIYSDTSGFALRDGRSAELVVNGENSGDWEFLAAAPRDATDDWVSEREQYLAQKLKYDVKYFDEYVWGAEDLDAYGDWNYTDDFGWIWRPRSNTINVFSDWAPYRYGNWTWCPPYGWTWVGYEPWGWAPYHYGRWVYYNNYWAWCPRSRFYKNRSWWRPALVAFVFDISFGNDICWYPLSYYQRDPHSRRYRRDHDGRDGRYGRAGRDGRDGRDGRHPGSGGGRRDGHDYGPWRGVTRLPRGDWGHPDRRGRGVDETVGRRVIERDPETGELPVRAGLAGNLPSGRGRTNGGEGGNDSGRSARRFPGRDIPDRPTGAAERRPGAPLDDDLRRSRVFRGREPRRDPSQPTNTAATPGTETRRSGAIARPEPVAPDPNVPRPERPGASDQPREGRAGRTGRPNQPDDGGERRGPNRGERAPRNAPDAGNPTEPRNEQPTTAPVVEPRREPRSEPVQPRPQIDPASQPGDSQPQPRPARQREEPSERRPEGRPGRSESPRNESPRNESPRNESPRNESPRSESPRNESPRNESPRSESPRNESPRTDSPRSEPRPEPRSEAPRSDSRPSRSESPRNDSPRPEPRSEPPRSESRPSRSESPRSESPRSESPRSESPRQEAPRSEPPRQESPRSEPQRNESPRSESPRSAPDRPSKPDRPTDNRRK